MYQTSQIFTSMFICALGAFLLYKAVMWQRDKQRGTGRTIWMVVLYVIAGFILLGTIGQLLTLGE